ncbi:hypothetical protein EST38_g3158 [Candolleomyces aberdarensis]|uniref:Mitochondrial oxaloacetate transport protein n=1 Tax=Candolleomyces aberdarensis TaxID=2316362 RepID=A0A4Q2DQI7_9AGAR|nr:hypothetical protein EST38_g3158 [Candolleomyces aberdarensis]
MASTSSKAQQRTLSTSEGFVCGGIAASIAVTVSNPAEVAKTRMQLQGELAKGGGVRVYNNSLDVFKKTFRNEGIRGLQRGLPPAYAYQILLNGSRLEGARGLVRGVDAAILRTSMGSSVQLPSYNFTKRTLVSNGILPEDSTWTFLASSSVSGACVLVCMQPADTALTRVYNQPTVVGPDGRSRGALYKNPIDCLWKTFKAEGVRGWYKGSTAHFMRIAPHTIITLTANDIIINFYKKAKYGPVDDDS